MPDTRTEKGWLDGEVWKHIRTHKWAILLASTLVVVPCFWHRHIEAGDLGSHVYNAWLAQLIDKGQAPGLYFARQWNNVLFDWVLLHAANSAGFAAAEKIVVSVCVLIFFWGVFALMAAASGRAPWLLSPCVAMLAYGYSFSMGFLNYYLSLGIACFSLALLWRGRGAERLAGLLLVPIVLLAHPLGTVWLLATAAYVAISTKLPKWWGLALPAAAAAAFFGLKWYLAHRVTFPVDWPQEPFCYFNGADQLVLYGARYATLEYIALGLGALCVAVEALRKKGDRSEWKSMRTPFELYVVALCATAFLPENVQPPTYAGWIGLLVSRLTTITATLGLSVLSCLKPRKWHFLGFGACAAAFFVFLYQDTATLSRMESDVGQMVDHLSFGTRVISTISAPEDWRVQFIGHLVDRACIGRCFSYGNYEPSSRQFRIRARPGSPVVTASADDAEDMAAGEYEVQDEDLPLKVIYQCSSTDPTKLCLGDLASGQKTGSLTQQAGSNDP